MSQADYNNTERSVFHWGELYFIGRKLDFLRKLVRQTLLCLLQILCKDIKQNAYTNQNNENNKLPFQSNHLFSLSYVYFNFDEDDALKSVFESNKNPQRIIELLSLIAGEKILPGQTSVIFDEVQECPEALNFVLQYGTEIIPVEAKGGEDDMRYPLKSILPKTVLRMRFDSLNADIGKTARLQICRYISQEKQKNFCNIQSPYIQCEGICR